jgi:hypothetical protein
METFMIPMNFPVMIILVCPWIISNYKSALATSIVISGVSVGVALPIRSKTSARYECYSRLIFCNKSSGFLPKLI